MSMKVGFIGLGIMGKPMAKNLLAAGVDLTVFNRTQSKADELISCGAKRADTPKEVADGVDFLITIVSDTPQVEEVLFGDDGAIQSLSSGTLVIDMSTISATEARRFSKNLIKRNVHMLDAPVSGGDLGAINATLTIMVGGDEKQFNRAKPLFDIMGSKSTLLGSAGAGQVAKSCNQVLVVNALMGVCEALTLADKQGLDLLQLIEALGAGAASSFQLDKLGPLIAVKNYEPGFMVDLVSKDLGIVQELSQASSIELKATTLIKNYYDSLQVQGDGKLGTQSLIKAISKE